MKYLYLLLSCFFITNCATSQWAFRNATDNEVRIIENIKGINSIFLTEKYLSLDVNTIYTSSRFNEDGKKRLCFDRIAFTPNTKENIIPIHSSTFICPQGIETQAKEKLIKGPDQSLIIRFQDQEESYNLKENIFHSQGSHILLSLTDGFKSKKLVKGNKLYYLLMPLTFTFDIITAPIQWGIFAYKMRKMNMTYKKEE